MRWKGKLFMKFMKEYQSLIGKIILAAAIIIAACIVASAIRAAGGSIGSQIASAIFNA